MFTEEPGTLLLMCFGENISTRIPVSNSVVDALLWWRGAHIHHAVAAEPAEDHHHRHHHHNPRGLWIIMRLFDRSVKARSGARFWSNTDTETMSCYTSSKRFTWDR